MTERTYNIPLRKGFINTARHKKTKKAVSTLKEFLQKHLKSDKIKIGKNFCAYKFQNKNRDVLRLTTFGYTMINEVLLDGG